MSQDLEKAVNNLSEISQKMNDPSNALNQFIADSAFADTLKITFRNLNKGLTEITEASEAVQRSGIVRAFSKDKKKKPSRSLRTNQGGLKDACGIKSQCVITSYSIHYTKLYDTYKSTVRVIIDPNDYY